MYVTDVKTGRIMRKGFDRDEYVVEPCRWYGETTMSKVFDDFRFRNISYMLTIDEKEEDDSLPNGKRKNSYRDKLNKKHWKLNR